MPFSQVLCPELTEGVRLWGYGEDEAVSLMRQLGAGEVVDGEDSCSLGSKVDATQLFGLMNKHVSEQTDDRVGWGVFGSIPVPSDEMFKVRHAFSGTGFWSSFRL